MTTSEQDFAQDDIKMPGRDFQEDQVTEVEEKYEAGTPFQGVPASK